MKKTLLLLLVLATLCAPLPAAKKTELTIQQIGVGLILGDPLGFSAKLWLDNETAIDAAVAWSSTAKFHLQADYVWHKVDMIELKDSPDKIAVYYGPGALIRIANDDSFVLGARGVIGINYIIKNAPFDTFVELAPSFFLTPSMHFTLLGGFGARFFF